MGLSWAWQSVKCSRCTLPKHGSSYIFAPAAAASASRAATGIPAAAATASTCRNSRRSIDIPVLRRSRSSACKARQAGDVLREHLTAVPEDDLAGAVHDIRLRQRAARPEPLVHLRRGHSDWEGVATLRDVVARRLHRLVDRERD